MCEAIMTATLPLKINLLSVLESPGVLKKRKERKDAIIIEHYKPISFAHRGVALTGGGAHLSNSESEDEASTCSGCVSCASFFFFPSAHPL